MLDADLLNDFAAVYAVNERQRFGQLLGFMTDPRTHKEEEGEQAAYDQNVNDRDCVLRLW